MKKKSILRKPKPSFFHLETELGNDFVCLKYEIELGVGRRSFRSPYIVTISLAFKSLGVVHNIRHGFRGEGCQGFCDNSTKALVMKNLTMGEWVSKKSKFA